MRHPFLSPTMAMIIALGAVTSRPATAQQVSNPTPLPQVAYQGRLIEAGVAVTGARVFTFSILDSSGNELWNSGNQTLLVDAGLYAVVLGSSAMPPISASGRSWIRSPVVLITSTAMAPGAASSGQAAARRSRVS